MTLTKVVYPEIKMPTEEQKAQWRKEEDERLAGYIVYVVSEDLKRGGAIAEALKEIIVNTVVDNIDRNGAIARAVRGRAEEVIP